MSKKVYWSPACSTSDVRTSKTTMDVGKVENTTDFVIMWSVVKDDTH